MQLLTRVLLQALKTLLTKMVMPDGLFQISTAAGSSHAMMLPLSSTQVEANAANYINFTGNGTTFVTLSNALEQFTSFPQLLLFLKRAKERQEQYGRSIP